MKLPITEDQVREAVTLAEVLDAVRRAHLATARGEAHNVVRHRARTPQMSLHTMSAASRELNMAAAKVYSATRGAVRSTVLLYETEHGEMLAEIEANELGRLRTAAASVVAAGVMCPKNVKSIGIIGAGYQGAGLLRAFCDASSGFKFEKALVFSRKEAQRSSFAKRMQGELNIPVEPSTTADELVGASEVLITCTTSSSPVVETVDDALNLRHISAVGSNSLTRRELGGYVVSRASMIAADARDAAEAEGGNLLGPIENGKIYLSQVRELGNLLTHPPELPEAGYTLFCSHGLAVQDLYLAELIYRKLS